MKRLLPLALVSLVTLPLCGLAQEAPAKPAPAHDALDLVFLRDTGPVLLRLHARVGEQSITGQFQAYLLKWFEYLDRNGDKKLDARELAGAPKAAAMIQLRNGNFFNTQQNNLTMAELGKGAEDTIAFGDFEAYYLRSNIQAITVADNQFGNPAGTQFYDQVNDNLFKALDLNKDGKLSKEELAAAPQSLRKFDLDGDEMILAQRLAPNAALGGGFRVPAGGGGRQPGTTNSAAFFTLNNLRRDRLPILLLAQYDKDNNTKLSREESGLDEAPFAALDKNRDGALDVEELAGWAQADPGVELLVQVPRSATEGVIEVQRVADNLKSAAKKTVPGACVLQLGDAEVSLRSVGSGAVARFDQRQIFTQQFTAADKDQRGFLEMADVQGAQFQFLRNLFTVADRNGDGKLTRDELQAYSALLGEATRSQASLTILEQGRTLFQILDSNRDGRLSPRELRTAWARLADRDRDKDGSIGLGEIPRQFQVLLVQGPAQNVFAFANPGAAGAVTQPVRVPLPRDVPDWFRKMDVTGDGDVSFQEFLGTRADFNRIDTDGDGLIDPQEAIRYQATVRKN